MNVAIVVVNFNGWSDTRTCLQSLARMTAPARILLVDNGSDDDRRGEFARDFPTVQFIRSEENRGWAGGNNIGILRAVAEGADQIILLNNDTTVSPKLVASLLAAAHANPDFGILGPVICFMDEPDVVMTDGCVFNHRKREGFFQREQVPLTLSSRVVEVDIVNGCCMMVSAAVIRKIGIIDERFFLVHEESDYCLRACDAGFRCGILSEALVWHKGSSSFQRTGKRAQRYYDARNLYLLLNKHADLARSGSRQTSEAASHRKSGDFRYEPNHAKQQSGHRGLIASMATYLRYVYHRWSIERENGNTEAANAVVEGLCDAFAGEYGPMRTRSHWGVRFVRGFFEMVHWWRRPSRSDVLGSNAAVSGSRNARM